MTLSKQHTQLSLNYIIRSIRGGEGYGHGSALLAPNMCFQTLFQFHLTLSKSSGINFFFLEVLSVPI